MNIDDDAMNRFGVPSAMRGGTSQAQPALLPQMARALLGIAAVACTAGSVMMLSLVPDGASVGALFAVLSLLSLGLTRTPTAWLPTALSAMLLLVMLGMAAAAVACNWGLGAPGLPLYGLLVCVACAAVGVPTGLVLAGVGASLIGAVALWVPAGLATPAAPSMAMQLGTQWLGILSGLAAGAMISRVVSRYTAAAQVREDRFSSLLALAADVYWELDENYHLVGTAQQGSSMQRFPGPSMPPWEMPRLGWDADTLDLLRAELEAREAFRDVQMTWARSDGGKRVFLISGEPRFGERGVFAGYWGVARDVTEIEAARRALVDTETRYEDLFSRIPTPLVMQRDGYVFDANPAALAMFGSPDLESLIGTDLVGLVEAGEGRERARRRLEALRDEPAGAALPVSEYKLHLAKGVISVRSIAVRIDAPSGPAVLSIYVDDTERLQAEEAIRRSEAMLSHLVATSPDLITLTEVDTGRYAMVNQAFERVTGWRSAEAVGRTARDLGIWGSDSARDAFVATLRACGTVSDMPVDFVTKTGAARRMQVSAARFMMDRRDYMVINARDVSEREHERQQIEAILANASIGITVVTDGRFTLVNAHYEAMYGWAPGELVGQSVLTIWGDAAEQDAAQESIWPRLERGEVVVLERTAHRRDGSTFQALVRGRAIDPARAREGGTVWIAEDMTERYRHEQALASARDAAEAANRAKSAFLANTSHELRTPLNAMIGLARLARLPDVAEARRQSYLDQITDSAQALSGIISDILDLAKIEAGRLKIETSAFDLGEQIRALHQTYSPLAQARGLVLSVEIEPRVEGPVRGDPLRLRQILSNFINNALKFTAQGVVGLRAQRGTGNMAERVRIEVRDTGPGIDEATRAQLFTPFTQADQSTTRRHGGAGLGLSIGRELARLMGGDVGVDSTPGVGSVFWAELPLPRDAEARPDTPPSSFAAASLEGTHVLIVEDNPVNMMIGVAMLERWGVTVEQAADGREAVVAVQRAADAGHPFDAVLMDVQMPVMGGHEATRVLRGLDAGRNLPIIALTAAALVSEREEALSAGMNDFLTKPVDANKLREALARWSITAI